MGRLGEREYTRISDREMVGLGLANSPAGVAFLSDLQRATYEDQPIDTEAAQEAAAQADSKATGAQTTADGAQAAADLAQAQADAAVEGLNEKVDRDATPLWQLPSGALSRSALTTYTAPSASASYDPVQMQILMDSHQAWTRRMAALITDLAAIGVLKD